MYKSGKNKFLTVLIFSAFSFFCLAEEKIAIVGDSGEAKKVADLISVALPSQYSVMERGEIEKILKEQKLSSAKIGSKEILALSKVLHVNFFITINSRESEKKVVPSRILLFDASNGFRLLDKTLPDNIEKAAEYSLDEIKKALSDSNKTEGKKFLSVLSVRNAGAPKKYEADFSNIALGIERSLAASPGIAILERESLGMINQERKISESFSKLTASAYLLDFEFLPGTKVSHVDMSLNILDSTGRQLSKITIDDCLKNPQKTIGTVLAELSKFLSVPVAVNSVSDKKEAERFFNEYKFCARIDELNAAERKLEAAIALNPDSPQYRIELARFLMKKAKKIPENLDNEARVNALLDAGNRAIDILEEAQERFPDKKSGYTQLDISEILNFSHDRQTFSLATLKKISDVSTRYRKHTFEELKQLHQFDLSDGINSLKELKNFKNYCISTSAASYYLDNDIAMLASFNSTAEFLKYGSDFLTKNPEILKNMPDEKQISLFIIFPDHSHTAEIPDNIAEMLNPVIAAAKEHPAAAVKIFGLNAALIRNAIASSFDQNKFAADMDSLLQKADESHLPSSSVFSTMTLTHSRFFSYHDNLGKIYFWKQIEHARKAKEIAEWNILAAYFSSRDWNSSQLLANKIEKLEPELNYWKTKQGIEKGEIEYFLKRLKKSIPETAEYEKAHKIIQNKSSVICKKVCSMSSGNIIATYEYNGDIYILTKAHNKHLDIFSFNPQSEKIQAIGNSGTLSLEFPERKCYEYEAFSVSEKYFLIGGNNSVMVIPRNGETPYFIADLPAENVNAIAIMNGRIYAFLGRINIHGKTLARETILASFLPDGSDRKIHVSTLRKEKKTYLDRFQPFTVHSLFADAAKARLIFTTGYPANGLWEIIPGTGESRQLIDTRDSSNDDWGMRTGNILYFAINSRYYTFNMDDDNSDFIFFSDYKNSSKFIKGQRPQYIRKEEQQVSPPFFFRKNQLWFGRYTIVFINPVELTNSEYINISEIGSNIFYPHPDGVSIYAFSCKNIYKLTPKNND